MKKPILLAFLASSAPIFGAVFTGTVTGDTYIRNDGGSNPTTNYNADTNGRLLVGSNAATDNLRALLKFDVSSIINDVNTVGGGNFANLTINSASLQIFERATRANTVNVIVNSYGFAFDPATSTWNAPATGDTTPGGSLGTALGSQSITWSATSANDDSSTIALSTSGLKTHLTSHLSNSVNFLLNTNTLSQNFVSITSDLASTDPTRRAMLTIDYTVTPAGGPEFTLDPASPQPDFTFAYSQNTATPSRTVRYKNTSASSPINVDAITITNSAGGVFTLGSVTPGLPATLAPGESIDIPVTAASATSGAFVGSIFVDTNAAGKDQTQPLNASFYQSGQLFSNNPSMIANSTSWGGSSTWVTPGLLGISGDGMARVRGTGDPLLPLVHSAHSQATSIPNNLPDWCLDFRFSPVAPAEFADYTGNTADGNFNDRSFQFVVQATDTVPAPALTDTLDDETLLNIAYLPDGITTGGIPGFYVFNQTAWQLIDFNGDGSALVLDGSTDVDTDANPTNGIGDGVLDATTGDTVNPYRLTVKGSGFGTGTASYAITLSGPGGLSKTVTGLTAYQNRNITTHLPASFAFISTDSSTASNSGGLCPSFWVDEVCYTATDRMAQRVIMVNQPTSLRSLNGVASTHTLTAINDGTSSADLSASLSGTSAATLTAPASFPVTLTPGVPTNLVLTADPALLVAPNTADAGILALTTTDPLLPGASYPFNVTKVTDANLAANGDFETVSANAPFPAGWTVTGTPSSVASFVPASGNAVSLAPGQGILQDLIPAGVAPLANFQVDYAFQMGNEAQANRIRIEGNNGADIVTLRLTANTPSADLIEVFNAGPWATALSGLTLNANTTYHLRIRGSNFGLTATHEYTIGISTDGVNYTTSAPLRATHIGGTLPFETVTFECGSTAGSSLLVENVVVTELAGNTFDNWMGGFTFAPSANLTPTGDADNDGISNLVEQVLGTAPNAATTGLTQISSDAASVSFQHLLNPDLASDVTYSYEWSTDLSEWKSSGQSNTGGVTATIVPTAPVSSTVTVTTTATVGTPVKLFTRLVANQNP